MNKIPQTELGRKFIHYLAALIPLTYHFFLDKKPAVIILSFVVAVMLIIEFMRFAIPSCRNIYNRYFGKMTRPHERTKNLTGATYLLMGSLLVVAIFPKELAVIAMFFVQVGDPSACLVGMSIGKIRLSRSKTLEGTLAFILSSLLVTWWIPGVPQHVKVAGAVTAGVLEYFTWRLDDNLVIPTVSALLMYLMLL
ncbi:MAG: hypothetical protein DRP96_04425 [Candidatus Neomarinimicrobiota bacterium]|nr:MAG: hypothetical protein DRP96_04425 [Candidatus Neomarinimicrobiota bacterium]